MSYLDPQGASERRAWDRPDDQREPEWTSAEDPGLRAWPGNAGPAAHPSAPDQQTGSPYGTTFGYDTPPPYDDRPASYETPTPYPPLDQGRHIDQGHYVDQGRHIDQGHHQSMLAAFQRGAAPPDTGRSGWDNRPPAPPSGNGQSPGGRAADTDYGAGGYPPHGGGHGPDPAYRPAGERPGRYPDPPDRHRADGYEPDWYPPDGSRPDRHRIDPYQADRYDADPYQTDRHLPGPDRADRYAPGAYHPDQHHTDQQQTDRYQPDRYAAGPHQPDGYEPDRYRAGGWSERHRPDAEPQARPYPTGGGESALAAPTDPVGWAPFADESPRSSGERRPPAERVPAADPYADTQTLPRLGAGPLVPQAGGTHPTGGAEPLGPAAGRPTPAVGPGGSAAAKPGAGRAGRNLPAAIGVGLALGALIVVPLFVYPLAFLVVIAAAATVGTWELTRAVRKGSGAEPPLPPLLGGGLLMVGLAWWAGPDALSLALLVTVLATLVWRLGDGPRGFQQDLTAATLIAVYVPFLGGFAALLTAAPGDGHLRVLVTLVAVVLSDTGGYAAGVMLGRHPMAPSVSPKKSWEGFAGSVVATAAGSAVLLWLLLDVAPVWGALFGMAISVAAVLGDLGESMIKRDLGVKDMSNLLPGHGGLMDRLDSVLFAMPVAYLLLAIFVPAG